ncbi:MAG: hypothetical protein PHR25_00350 [Clostridia bacterium]|nr:hypothetical protein [Clostridia bacterium]MDD4375224.1 hypothetical protein [Clostridia bacterium]
MEKDKKYNVILGLMIFFFIALVGVAFAFALGIFSINSDKIEDLDNASQKTDISAGFGNEVKEDEDIIKEEKTKEPERNESKPAVSSGDNVNNNVTIDLENKKCLNNNYAKYSWSSLNYNHGVYGGKENGKIYVGVNNSELKDAYDNLNLELYKSYEVTGIDVSKVATIFISGWGQGITIPAVFFLMTDGTVEWLNLEDSFTKGDYKAEGKISNVSNVVKITNAAATGGFGGGGTIVGIRNDGNFYDLCQETVNKN